MNKTKKIFIISIIIYTICATFLTSFAANWTNPRDGKGTVTFLTETEDGKTLDESTRGTVENPYQLVLGEPLIDIYYGDYAEAIKNGIYFEFVGGNYNAANYIVENNVDKGRLRFKLQGTGEDYLKVTSDKGLNYLQAGAVCYIPDYLQEKDKDGNENPNSGDIQVPYYSIQAFETFTISEVTTENQIELTHEPVLGNGYLVTNDTMLNNVSTYGTAYIFAKSNLNFNDVYKLDSKQEQNLENMKINYWPIGQGIFREERR